jgi:hypothetical protein
VKTGIGFSFIASARSTYRIHSELRLQPIARSKMACF